MANFLYKMRSGCIVCSARAVEVLELEAAAGFDKCSVAAEHEDVDASGQCML